MAMLHKLFSSKVRIELLSTFLLLGRDINPSLFQISEMKQRMKDQDPFIGRVMAEPKIMLIGNEDELRRLAQ